MASILITFFVSLLVTYALIPWFSKRAIGIGLVDNPDKSRKLHESAIPMVGGLAIFCTCSLIITVIFTLTWYEFPYLEKLDRKLAWWLGYPADYLSLHRIRSSDIRQYVGLFLGSLILLIVGLLDDRFGIRGRQKLFGQFLAATVLVWFGYRFDSLLFLHIYLDLNVFSVLFIYGWILASINSVNLLDGADGIAATIGFIMSMALAIMMISQGRVVDSLVAVSVAGSLIGFLRYNFPPATVYLGDAGSMLIGFLLSALAIRSTLKQNSLYAFLAPLALLAIPFIDTAAAIIRRRLTGRSIFAVDRGHLHHKLMKSGLGPRASIVWVALLCAMSATGGVLAMVWRQPEYAILAVVCVGVVMFMSKIFGVGETELVVKRAYNLSRRLIGNPRANSSSDSGETSVHVQGELDWETHWHWLLEFAKTHQLHLVKFDINAPWLHESYHAKWKSQNKIREANHLWQSVIPLIVADRIFGSVVVKCSQDSSSSHRDIINGILDYASTLEAIILDAQGETAAEEKTTGASASEEIGSISND